MPSVLILRGRSLRSVLQPATRELSEKSINQNVFT